MKSFFRLGGAATVGLLSSVLLAGQSEAVTFSLRSSAPSVQEGDTFSVDIFASDFDNPPPLGFDLNIQFDNSLLSFVNGSFSFTPVDQNEIALEPSGNEVEVFAFGFSGLPNIIPETSPGEFFFATLNLTADNAGTAAIEFAGTNDIIDSTDNFIGLNDPGNTVNNASVTITEASQPPPPSTKIPEPGTTAALIALGIGVVGNELRHRRKKGYKKVSQSWSALFKWISFSERLLPADRPHCEG